MNGVKMQCLDVRMIYTDNIFIIFDIVALILPLYFHYLKKYILLQYSITRSAFDERKPATILNS